MPPRPYDLNRTLRVLRRGSGDLTCRLDDDGTWWRVSRTPLGPATLRITGHIPAAGDGRVITGQAWGPGAQWALAI